MKDEGRPCALSRVCWKNFMILLQLLSVTIVRDLIYLRNHLHSESLSTASCMMFILVFVLAGLLAPLLSGPRASCHKP